MTAPIIPFTRVPSVKVPIVVNNSGLVGADNTLIIIGHMAASGSTATAGQPVQINNFGDPAAAALECTTLFGASSEAGAMVVAAIQGVLFSSLAVKLFPPIKVIPLASGATSSVLAGILGSLLTLPAGYVVSPFNGTDVAGLTALSNYLTAISGNDRGDNGQFGSFGFVAVDGDTSAVTPVGIGAASEKLCFPWLRDLATIKSNPASSVAAAYGAVCASLAVPYLPLDGITVGGLLAPVSSADYHSSGDTGTVSLGLSAGLTPLVTTAGGKVAISRSITSLRTVSSVEDAAYYDMQDWQVLYYLRKNAYNIASQPRYRQAKASIAKFQALKSELFQLCKQLESLEMLQYVDLLANQFTVVRSLQNRHAGLFSVPVNVIPGFHNKGIELDAGVLFDVVVG
jgi:phage tail sheath gpL-like